MAWLALLLLDRAKFPSAVTVGGRRRPFAGCYLALASAIKWNGMNE